MDERKRKKVLDAQIKELARLFSDDIRYIEQEMEKRKKDELRKKVTMELLIYISENKDLAKLANLMDDSQTFLICYEKCSLAREVLLERYVKN